MLVTAGGRIKCRRCTAKSSHTKEQCKRPASKLSKTSKCSRHGGLSTGPKTEEGKNRIRAAHWKHGRETIKAKKRRSLMNLKIAKLEDMGRTVGLFRGPKRSGRKPNGYTD